MKIGDSYIQIGRLELFYTRYWDVGRSHKMKNSCGCDIFHLGFVGFTILSKECARDL